MEATAAERIVPLVLECPQCGGEKRGTSLKRSALIGLLEEDADVRVMGGACGHIWSLTADEKKNLRRALAEGSI